MAQFTVPTENELYSQTTDPEESGDIVQVQAGAAVEFDDCDLTVTGNGYWRASQNKLTFTSGDSCPVPGSTISGASSGRTAKVVGVVISSGGFGTGDAAGSLFYETKSAATAFTPGEILSCSDPVDADCMTVGTDSGNATDPTLTLDQVNMVEGTGCIKVTFSTSASCRMISCYLTTPVDLTGQVRLLGSVLSGSTNTYTYGISESGCIHGGSATYYSTIACTGGDWEKLSWDIVLIPTADKDATKFFAIYDLSLSLTVPIMRIDRIYFPVLGVDRIKSNLLGTVVQLYPGRGSPVRPFKFPIFGNGTADLTVSSDTTLGDSTIQFKVLEYDNVTIEDGHFLKAHANEKGLVILVRDTLTLGVGSYISMNGRGADGGAAATGGVSGVIGGGGGGGASATDAGSGGAGGGQPGENASGGTLGNGGGQAGNNQARSFPGCGYGRGGNGGAVATVGGAGTRPAHIENLYSLIPMSPEVAFQMFGGGGGGGGSATGGAGGAGGGVIWIEAKTIVWGAGAYITADGVDGSQGASNKGGGGGGGAGCIVCIYETDSGSQTFSVTRGSGGAANGSGKAGGVGSHGIGQYIKLEAEILELSVS